MARLQLLAPLGLWGADGREIRPLLRQPKRLALLVYLVLAQGSGFCRRDTLTALFWPELDQEHARRALRQALHFLRAALGSDAIVSRGDDDVRVATDVVSCDVLAFREALAEDRPVAALELYRNDLLPGFFVADAREFERWLELERATLRHAAVSAAWRLAEQPGEEDAGLHWARRAAALRPEDESNVQRLLRFQLERGDRTGALETYEGLRRRLRSEFGLTPSDETVRLVRAIRAGVRPDEPIAGASPEAEAAAADSAPGDRDTVRLPTVSTAADVANPGDARSRRRSWAPAVAGVVLALAVVAGASVLVRSRTGRAAAGLDADVVAVSPFQVADARYEVWREGLMSVLTTNLDGAGPLRTAPIALVLRHWPGRFDGEAATQLGRATGAGLAVTGRVDAAGSDSVRILATLVDARRGQTLAQIEVWGAADRFDRLTDTLTVALLRELGRTRPIGAVRAASIGSHSLPALKAFLRGEQLYRRTQWDSALILYRQAVELDSTFALALRRIGTVLMWQGLAGDEVGREYHARAGRFNHGLSPRDSLLVLADSLSSALYGFDADPDWWRQARRAAATLAEAGRRYPDDPEVWTATGEQGFHLQPLVGVTLADIMTAFDRAILLDSSFAPAYLHPICLAMTMGDSARALLYARAYLRHARDDFPARGIALFERVLRQGGLSSVDSAAYAGGADPGELFGAWAAFGEYPDRAESLAQLARALAGRRWATPMPFADPAFATDLLARSLALRGHLAEAYRVVGSSDPELFGELAWLGAVPERDVRPLFARWLAREDGSAARHLLPWLSEHGDATAITEFVRRRGAIADAARAPAAGGPSRVARDRARFDVAAGHAWLALARADTSAALRLFLAVPDSLCPRCALHRLLRAELLLRSQRTGEARVLLARELTAIQGGPRPADVRWRLARAEAEERSGAAAAAAASYRGVLQLWRNADPTQRPLLERARSGLARVRGS